MPFYLVVLWIKPGALWMLDKHPENWATSLSPSVSVSVSSVCMCMPWPMCGCQRAILYRVSSLPPWYGFWGLNSDHLICMASVASAFLPMGYFTIPIHHSPYTWKNTQKLLNTMVRWGVCFFQWIYDLVAMDLTWLTYFQGFQRTLQ